MDRNMSRVLDSQYRRNCIFKIPSPSKTAKTVRNSRKSGNFAPSARVFNSRAPGGFLFTKIQPPGFFSPPPPPIWSGPPPERKISAAGGTGKRAHFTISRREERSRV